MRWKCVCAYDGGAFSGWQIQAGSSSIQQVIEDALAEVFKTRVVAHGSGRTDAGVHALEQVFHFDFHWPHGSERLIKALYTKLPKAIRILSATEVGDDFHARFAAVSKRYQYRLFLGQADPFRWPYCWSVPDRLDLNRIERALRLMVGTHDFAAFAANRRVEYETTERTVTGARLSADGDYVYLTFEADGFMYKMVRSFAGTLVNVGQRRIEPEEIARLLETRERTAMVQVAPARGLYLAKVFY